MDAQLPREPVERLGRVLRAAAPAEWARMDLQWSQAAVQHSGRLLLVRADGAEWIPLPAEAVQLLTEMRTAMADPQRGAWLLLTASTWPSGEVTANVSYDHRPYWNSPEVSMLVAPQVFPVPTDAQWQADLQRFPRERAHTPGWLTPVEFAGEASAQLRQGLDGAGFPRSAVRLPGDPEEGFEGRLEVVRYGARHYGLRISDYGQHALLGEFYTEREACDAAWHYLHTPLPAPIAVTAADLQARLAQARQHIAELSRRVAAAGPGGMVTNLATGLPYDRLGGLDGLYFHLWNTPWEQRSLPDTAWAPGAVQVVFVAARAVEVQAELAPAWFDQPGGGLRFRVQPPARGVRDLLQSGVLAPVVVR